MDPLTQLIFIVIVSNAGGEGKTMLAQLLYALWGLIGEPTALLDGDPGNMAARVAEKEARVVGWGVGPSIAPKIFQATQGGHVILDLGANSLASHREIVDLLPALRETFAKANYRTIALMPVSTNKLGAVEAIKGLEQKIEGFETLFVRVNRDGSNTFDKGLEGQRSVDVGHLQPGFQNYVRGPGVSMVQSVVSPPPEYKLASNYVADWMRHFAAQQEVIEFMGDRALRRLDDLHPQRGAHLRLVVNNLANTKNASLVANQRKSGILNAIDQHGWNANGIVNVLAMFQRGELIGVDL